MVDQRTDFARAVIELVCDEPLFVIRLDLLPDVSTASTPSRREYREYPFPTRVPRAPLPLRPTERSRTCATVRAAGAKTNPRKSHEPS